MKEQREQYLITLTRPSGVSADKLHAAVHRAVNFSFQFPDFQPVEVHKHTPFDWRGLNVHAFFSIILLLPVLGLLTGNPEWALEVLRSMAKGTAFGLALAAAMALARFFFFKKSGGGPRD